MKTISQERLAAVISELKKAAAAVGRDVDEITLIGVSKFHPSETVIEMALAGLRDFGENRVQEAAGKRAEVEARLTEQGFDPRLIHWHMVGHLQSNKAVKAAAIFDVIHSVDSVELAKRLAEAAQELGKRLDCLVQVNTSGEITKSGVDISKAIEIAEVIVSEPALRFKGLMTIGPLTNNPTLIKQSFERLGALRDDIERSHPAWGRLELSMGMTDDFPAAIACGATMVRIGTALFGSRALNKQEGA